VDGFWATKSEGVGLIDHGFPRFPTYVILIHRQTERRTDRRHAISIPRFAL